MDKKVEILRKRNIELSNQILELEKALKSAQEQLDSSELKQIQKLSNEFITVIASLKEKEQEYNELISEVREMRDFMDTVEFRDLWIKKAKKNFQKN